MAGFGIARMATLCAFVLLLPSCATVQLVSDYDEQTETGATALQKEVAMFFVKLDTATTPSERSFIANQQFYKDAAISIALLASRAQAFPKNSQTIEQIDKLKQNIAWLALLHKGCVTAPLNETQTAAVKDKGIDASIACREDYGASVAAPDRSGSMLNPALASPAQQLIDTGLTSIVSLEIAKKRGQTEN